MRDTPREYIDAVAPLFESHKVQPEALRILGTEREYSYTEAEWTGYRRAWGMRVSIAARHPEDQEALDEYLCAVVGNQFFKMYLSPSTPISGKDLMKYVLLDEATVKRWPRVKPHWRRFHRRLCRHCHNSAHLSEPRYLVCSGCGVARYCSEACQAADWPKHQEQCCWLLRWAQQKREFAERKVHARAPRGRGEAPDRR